jgi:radical SAM superfamily enzyme YgiQ (UPF0313 family)
MYSGKGGRTISRIACIQLAHSLPTVFDRVVFPRYGLPVIGTILKKTGYDVKVFEEHIAPLDDAWILGAHVVVFSALTGSANRTYKLASQLKKKNPKMITIIGGEHATQFIEESLDHMDFVIRGEGDESILELIAAIKKGGPFTGISGVSYRQNGLSIHNPITSVPKNLNESYAIDIIHRYPKEGPLGMVLKHRKIKMMTIQASRGCPFNCSFCIVHQLFGYSYRYRDVESIVKDIKEKLAYGNDFLFVDNLFTGNSKKVNLLLERMIEENLGESAQFCAFSRIDIAEDPNFLRKLRKAGFRTLIVGIESVNDETLERLHKSQSSEKINNSIKAFHDADLLISATFIVGNEEDGPGSVKRLVDFSLKNNLSQIILLSLWSYPGDPDSSLSPERLIMPSFDYFGGNYAVHFPLNMKPSTLQREMTKGSKKFWSLKRGLKNLLTFNFRTALQIFYHHLAYLKIWQAQKKYTTYLEKSEAGYYDEEERLILEKIKHRPLDPIVKRAVAVSGITVDKLASQDKKSRTPDVVLQT